MVVVKRGRMVSKGYLKAWADERNRVDVGRDGVGARGLSHRFVCGGTRGRRSPEIRFR